MSAVRQRAAAVVAFVNACPAGLDSIVASGQCAADFFGIIDQIRTKLLSVGAMFSIAVRSKSAIQLIDCSAIHGILCGSICSLSGATNEPVHHRTEQ
jgi:hypothetical protein